MDYLHTHYHHSHLDQRKALASLSLSTPWWGGFVVFQGSEVTVLELIMTTTHVYSVPHLLRDSHAPCSFLYKIL